MGVLFNVNFLLGNIPSMYMLWIIYSSTRIPTNIYVYVCVGV